MREDTPTRLTEAVELKTVLKARKKRNLESFLVRQAAQFIERTTGRPLLIELPDVLKEFGLAAEEPLRLAKALYDRNLVPEVQLRRAHFPDEPGLFYASFEKDSGGADFFEPALALWRALAEYIERELWKNEYAWYRPRLIHGTPLARGPKAIDLQTLAGFSEAQRSNNPLLSITADTDFGWVPATSIATGNPVEVPAQLMSAYYWHRERGGEPMLRWPITTGLATGQSLEEAVLRGALEVIERDAFMITYLNRISPPRIDNDTLAAWDPDFADILSAFKRNRLEVYILALPSDFKVPIICAAIVDRTGKGPALSVGAKADFTLRRAITGALSEALSIRMHLKQHDPLPEDFPRHKITREERLRYWIDLDRLPDIDFLFKGKTIAPGEVAGNAPDRPSKADLAQITRMLRENQCDMFFSEITSEKIRAITPFRTVFVMSPHLQPLHLDESTPYVGGRRLSEVPSKLGYASAKKLNPFPHPFP